MMDDGLNLRALPTIDALYGAAYDQRADASAPVRKLIVCATPRSSSYYLAQLAHSAGCGLPLEYFQTGAEQELAARLQVRPGDRDFTTDEYLDAVMQARSFNGIFATKLLHGQLRRLGRDVLGKRLFDGAVVVYLTRRNLAAQAVSITLASLTGNWHGHAGQGLAPGRFSDDMLLQRLKRALRNLANDEASFRYFFAAERISPICLFQEDLVASPATAIAAIADSLGQPFDPGQLLAAASSVSAYKDNEDLRRHLKEDILPRLDGYGHVLRSGRWSRIVKRKLGRPAH